ncbi:MAG: polysaccharide biosynthesis protein [Chloroflexi bacterium]|nr:polysaccharide biosynthesis protein [Chloroflexota bacterium]
MSAPASEPAEAGRGAPTDATPGDAVGQSTAGRLQTTRRTFRRVATWALFVLFDGLVVAGAYAIALQLRFDGPVPTAYTIRLREALPAVVATYVATSLLFRMYWRGWRYASMYDALALAQAAVLSTGLVFIVDAVVFSLVHPIPLSVVPVGGLFALLGMGVIRFRHRLLQEVVVALRRPPRSRLLIVGAGQRGQWLARELLCSPALGYRPVCFVDDDPEKQGQRIHGLPVAGTRHGIQRLVEQHKVEVIAFAIPSVSVEERREILARCEATSARIKIVPGLPDVLAGQSSTALFRDARLEDLLGRPPVAFARRASHGALSRSVLVTGAAGSIGSELARQVAAIGPQRLILLDTNETGLFDLAAELESPGAASQTRLEVVVADVTRPERIGRVFAQHRPAVVFHSAAYKHVPLMEVHPEEAAITNVLGTFNVCLAAEREGCERVVFISTDKAVAPASVMGATKRVGERLIEAFSAGSQTVFCAVRFGNVLGSRGSVVPIFARQIRQGGPITITDPETTRFFMTIPEAANLIIEAACQAEGGELFILDMGDPVGIVDLARKMIRLHGLRPGEDIEIREIGLRPGEKLHESLVGSTESLAPTKHPRVSRVLSRAAAPASREELVRGIEQLRWLAEMGPAEALVSTLFALAGASAVSGEAAVGSRQ